MLSSFAVCVLGVAALWLVDAPVWALVLLVAQAALAWFAALARDAAYEDLAKRFIALGQFLLELRSALAFEVNESKASASLADAALERIRDAVADLDVGRYSRRKWIDDE